LRDEVARAAGMRPDELALTGQLGDERTLQRRERLEPLVDERPRELGGEVGVGARGRSVAQAQMATRTPLERLDAKPTRVRALSEHDGCIEQGDGVRDLAELEAAATEPEERLGAVDVVEDLTLREGARLLARLGGPHVEKRPKRRALLGRRRRSRRGGR